MPLTLYALSLPDGEALRRVRERNRKLGALFIADETFRLFRARFEPLEPDEEAVVAAVGG
ncbi:hypothetical protein DAERI_040160 [Deinococcus aerius]|uniref:Uncharacterized protein n=1 Tax=Deinococcus aerius TaxID=200253 RepID=A0A2I9D4Z3_9DEIO|nr:hypothetical protein [Deinococcus aerius]GBF05400.1 hypothetical protein DAERI_040160 [Deinococcus aerius]